MMSELVATGMSSVGCCVGLLFFFSAINVKYIYIYIYIYIDLSKTKNKIIFCQKRLSTFKPHTQCLGFLLGYSPGFAFICYVYVVCCCSGGCFENVCYVVICYVVICYAVICYVVIPMLLYAMLLYAMLFFAVSGGCSEKCSLGHQGLINSGDIYKYSHPHIFIYNK